MDKPEPSPISHTPVEEQGQEFARAAFEQAQLSKAEDDRIHPLVGAVVVKAGKILALAHRGEQGGSHAEYCAVELKLPKESIQGCTVYTTLEPCISRTHPKVSCADRLIER